MPRRTTAISEATSVKCRNHSFELLVATWLMQAGWQVFVPLLDDGHCTDLLISDGPRFFRLQIKTVESQDENLQLVNRWKGVKIDFVVCFAKNSNWGFVCPAFSTNQKRLNHPDHKRFLQSKGAFLAAFHTI